MHYEGVPPKVSGLIGVGKFASDDLGTYSLAMTRSHVMAYHIHDSTSSGNMIRLEESQEATEAAQGSTKLE
jgi:hypothetical protein